MRYGDISGLGCVYDRAGVPLVGEGEEIKDESVRKASLYGREGRLMRFFAGKLYLTGNRAIFIRRTPGFWELFNEPDLGFMSALDEYTDGLNARAKGGKEYIEFSYDEISSIEVGKRSSKVALSGGFYIMLDDVSALKRCAKANK